MTPPPDLYNEYQTIKKKLVSANFTISDFVQIPYGLQFTASRDAWSGLIRIYQNKKGVIRRDYSQLKGEYTQEVIALIDDNANKFKPADEFPKTIGKGAVQELGFPLIGTDESGKGDYFGPLVAAGVYADVEAAKKLVEIGVKDSKLLSDRKIAELPHQIISIVKARHSIIEVSPERYNSLYEQFRQEKKNLNSLLAWGHAKAIEEILAKVDCDLAVADQFADERFIIGKLQERGKRIKLIQMPKAEENIAVAAASVLARARFVERLDKLSKQYGFDLPKGASSSVVQTARDLVKKHGVDVLKKISKLHFKTTASITSI